MLGPSCHKVGVVLKLKVNDVGAVTFALRDAGPCRSIINSNTVVCIA